MARARGATTASNATRGRSPTPHTAWEGGDYKIYIVTKVLIGVSPYFTAAAHRKLVSVVVGCFLV
eukprot:scaffold52163_cov75-Phaeocystis_antarctica.AAC.1